MSEMRFDPVGDPFRAVDRLTGRQASAAETAAATGVVRRPWRRHHPAAKG